MMMMMVTFTPVLASCFEGAKAGNPVSLAAIDRPSDDHPENGKVSIIFDSTFILTQ